MKGFTNFLLLLAATAGTVLAGHDGTNGEDACESLCETFVLEVGTKSCPVSTTSTTTSHGGHGHKLGKRYQSTSTTTIKCACSDSVLTDTYALCISNCSNKSKAKSWAAWVTSCATYDVTVSESYDDVLAAAEENYIEQADYTTGATTTVPVMINTTYLLLTMRADNASTRNTTWSQYYGNILIAYIGFFVLASGIYNLYQRIFDINKPESRLVVKFRQYFTMPAAFGGKHAEPLKIGKLSVGTLHSRWQMIAIFGFYALNIIFLFVSIDVFKENLTSTVQAQWRDYLTTRSGVIATVLCVPTFLFGGRNNILMYISGWSFETCNVWHRHIGFWMMWQSAIHGIAYTAQYIIYDNYASRIWGQFNIFAGTLATLLAGILILLTWYPIRHYYYEIFLVLHIGLAGAFARYCYAHVVAERYPKYMYAMVAVWAFDRFVRLVRICLHGLYLEAEITATGDATMVKIKPWFNWKPKPGQYAFLYIADPRFKFWESHPFSIIESRDGTYRFIVGKQSGMTKMLYDRAAKGENSTAKIRVMVEGFYGEEQPVRRYGTVLVVGGGIGITAAMSTTLSLVRRAQNNQRVIFYWVLRGRETLGWVKEQVEEICRGSNIEVNILCRPSDAAEAAAFAEKTVGASSEDDTDSAGSFSEEKVSRTNSSDYPVSVTMFNDRPDFDKIVSTVIAEAPGSVAVLTCGPGSLVDVCRRSVAENLGNGKGRVEYFEDAFSWA
ncbi:ferric reductase NAD binding domain-containing protein [Limtongia smithiae]|uniref:ferric reductase NAD binding domain-containing protein n=1 Tax=Limtongia smithiae TaxID=1125753 RepID=UPI0034CDF137